MKKEIIQPISFPSWVGTQERLQYFFLLKHFAFLCHGEGVSWQFRPHLPLKHCSRVGPYLGTWVPIGTLLTIWVPIFIKGPYFSRFRLMYALKVTRAKPAICTQCRLCEVKFHFRLIITDYFQLRTCFLLATVT